MPFAYKPFKEDFQPVVNPRIELEKRKIVEKDKLIEGIYGSFNVQNGLSQFEYMNIYQKGIVFLMLIQNTILMYDFINYHFSFN